MDYRKKLIFTLINAFLFISTIIVTYVTLAYGTVAGQVDTGTNYGWFYIFTFTVESNILMGLIAGGACICGVRSLVKKTNLPKSLPTWYLIGATSAMLTFLIVVLFLAPVRAITTGRSYFDMLIGPMFFFHFFNPVLAAITLIFFTSKGHLGRGACFFALIPPALYAVLYIINVVFLQTWNDFYGFTFGGRYYLVPLVILVVCLIVFAIASGLAHLHNRINQARK